MRKKAIIISILMTIVLMVTLSIFLIFKNKKIYISKIDEIDKVKISMLKLQNGESAIIKSVPTSGSWIMTYDCDDEDVKIYWDEGNRKLLMKNIKPAECTIKFEESISAINFVSIYVDDVYVEKLDENKTYDLERYECANEETVTWDNLINKITILPITKSTNCKLYFKKGDYDVLKGVNSPRLVSGMTPVKWTGTPGNYVETTTTEDDPEWYNYSQKKWANAKTADGSYWVWIPRYAYKITSCYHKSAAECEVLTGNKAGEIDVKFLIGKTNKTADGTTIETSGYNADTKNTSMLYFTHPAFQNNTSIGGWDSELTGIWVAKYEASVANQSDACYTAESSTNCNKNTLIPAFKPNVKSWKYINNSNIFDVSYNLRSNSNYGWQSSNIDTHMIKNTEWGAVVYLAQSIYGANQEIYINNSSTFMTGCGGNSSSEGSYAGCQNAYNSATGVKASTTHNITGIYDMSGGTYERTAAYVNNGDTSLTSNGQTLVNAAAKYKNVYTKAATDNAQNNYVENKHKYGDAMWETSSAGTAPTSWHLDYSSMTFTTNPWFYRGSYYGGGTNAGLFYFGENTGGNGTYTGFRSVVVIP